MYHFTEDCLIGIEQIDGEHKKLFNMINQGMSMLNEEDNIAVMTAKSLIPSLKNYALEHFAHEEKYMVEINDKELLRQKKEHAEFTAYMEKFDVEGLNAENGKVALNELMIYLTRWLYHHILSSDMMIGYDKNDDVNADHFAFTVKYRTGIAHIDDEHEKLFEIIRRTDEAIHAELVHDKFDLIVDIINELKDYTIFHFKDEEEYMESIHYDGLEAQKLAHEAFVEKIKLINLDDVDENQQEYLEELIEYLLGWLSAHILKMDKKIPMK